MSFLDGKYEIDGYGNVIRQDTREVIYGHLSQRIRDAAQWDPIGNGVTYAEIRDGKAVSEPDAAVDKRTPKEMFQDSMYGTFSGLSKASNPPSSAPAEKAGKGKVTNLPMGGMAALLRIEAMGREKHGPRSWTDIEAYPMSGYIDAMFRHLLPVLTKGPHSKDDESGEYHLAHIAWNTLRILHFLETAE